MLAAEVHLRGQLPRGAGADRCFTGEARPAVDRRHHQSDQQIQAVSTHASRRSRRPGVHDDGVRNILEARSGKSAWRRRSPPRSCIRQPGWAISRRQPFQWRSERRNELAPAPVYNMGGLGLPGGAAKGTTVF